MIKALLIDIDNTLLDFNKCAKYSMLTGFEENGLKFEEYMFDVFNEINNGLWRDIETGALTREGLYEIRWERIFARLGIDFDGRRFEACFRQNLNKCALPVDGANELLRYLAPKYTLCAASNGPFEQQKKRLADAGMLPFMSHLFISEQVGYSKPAAEFFDFCLAALGTVFADEVMIIGDSLTADINGAADYGIKSCWYNHNAEEIPADCAADYTVHSLSEIKDIL